MTINDIIGSLNELVYRNDLSQDEIKAALKEEIRVLQLIHDKNMKRAGAISFYLDEIDKL